MEEDETAEEVGSCVITRFIKSLLTLVSELSIQKELNSMLNFTWTTFEWLYNPLPSPTPRRSVTLQLIIDTFVFSSKIQ